MRPSSPNGPAFTHTRNGDGTITSVCNRCPLTVACAIDEKDLGELESRHVCQLVERRRVVRIVHRTYIPPTRSSELKDQGRVVVNECRSGLSQAAKLELIKTHLFLHPCSRCAKAVEHLSPNDERVCFTCQFSLKSRWKELAAAAPVLPEGKETGHRHELELYSSEEGFLRVFTRFIGTALRAGDAVLVAATPPHRTALFQRLQADGLDVAAAREQGRYIPVDVAETLSALMTNDLPDPVQFWKKAKYLVGTARKAARGKHRRVAACGECAPLLWQRGKADAAIQLEELWDELARAEGVDILCGYPGSSFRSDRGSETLQRILAEHSAVHAG